MSSIGVIQRLERSVDRRLWAGMSVALLMALLTDKCWSHIINNTWFSSDQQLHQHRVWSVFYHSPTIQYEILASSLHYSTLVNVWWQLKCHFLHQLATHWYNPSLLFTCSTVHMPRLPPNILHLLCEIISVSQNLYFKNWKMLLEQSSAAWMLSLVHWGIVYSTLVHWDSRKK